MKKAAHFLTAYSNTRAETGEPREDPKKEVNLLNIIREDPHLHLPHQQCRLTLKDKKDLICWKMLGTE